MAACRRRLPPSRDRDLHAELERGATRLVFIFQDRTVNAENAICYIEVFADIDVRAIPKDVQAPTLVMHTRGDRRIPLVTGGELAAEIPGAEFVTLDSDNHLLLGREPAWLAFVAHLRQLPSVPLRVG